MHNTAKNNEEVQQRLNKRRSISPINNFPEYHHHHHHHYQHHHQQHHQNHHHHKVHPYYEIPLVNTIKYECEPLDLTRRDSVETRRTISPRSDELSPSRSSLIAISGQQQQKNSQQTIIPSPKYNNNFPLPTVDHLAVVLTPKQEPLSPIPENYHDQCSTVSSDTNINNSTITSSSPIQQRRDQSPSQSQSSSQQSSEQLAIANFNQRYQLEQYKAIQLAQLTINRDMPPSATVSSSLSPLSSISSVSSTAPPAPTLLPTPTITPIIGPDGKPIRPFKLYPKNPLKFIDDSSISRDSDEKYKAYRGEMIEKIYKENGGFATKTNPKMRRISAKNSSTFNDNDDQKIDNNITNNNNDNLSGTDSVGNKDEAYYERRKKNNAAAKKSRDRRRVKEDELAIRAGYLEQENFELRKGLAASLEKENIAKETIEQLRNQLNNLINKMHNNN